MLQQVEIEINIPDEYIDLTANELENMETITQGYADDLKIDDGRFKVWFSRCGVEDGMPYDNAVIIETVIEGKYVDVLMYEAL